MRDLAQRGAWDELQAFVKNLQDKEALKVTELGTNLKRLGAGNEAVTDLVVGAGGKRLAAKTPLSARKVYDQASPVFSQEQLAEKINVQRRLRNRPEGEQFAQLYGGLRKTPGGAKYTLNEFVADGTPTKIDPIYMENILRQPENQQRYLQSIKKTPYKLTKQEARMDKEDLDALLADQYQVQRAAKQKRISDIRKAQGVKPSAAEFEARQAVPSLGNPKILDLVDANVLKTPNGKNKIIDFSVMPSHREMDASSARINARDMRRKQQVLSPHVERKLQAEQLRATFGTNTGPSQISPEGKFVGSLAYGKDPGTVLNQLKTR
jgi:hypothetical protein